MHEHKNFKNKPSTLARFIREGTHWTDKTENKADLNEIKALFTGLWGTCPEISIPFDQSQTQTEVRKEDILSSVSTKEVGNRIKRFKANTVPGADGIMRHQLKREEVVNALSCFYNVLLITGTQPTEWSRNRTILIPKPGKNPTKADSYRPITIGSLTSRLFWGIIDTRLRGITTFSPRQK
jgi:hypothetical protein